MKEWNIILVSWVTVTSKVDTDYCPERTQRHASRSCRTQGQCVRSDDAKKALENVEGMLHESIDLRQS